MQATEHPVDLLMSEHRIILAVLNAMEQGEARLARGETVDPGFWRDCVRFIEDFADRHHHGKEEDLLFPALFGAGMPEEAGPVAVMLAEHDAGRAQKAAITRALDRGDNAALRDATREFVPFLRAHIQKEDHCLFPMARDLLPAQQTEQLATDFDHFERDPAGQETRTRCIRMAGDLCAAMSVQKPEVDDPTKASPSGHSPTI